MQHRAHSLRSFFTILAPLTLPESEHSQYDRAMSYAHFWGNRLVLMAKPPAEIAALLAADPRADHRPADRLHITLTSLGMAEPARVDRLRAALEEFAGAPFRVAFDRIHCSGKTVARRGSETMRGAIRAQAALRHHLIRAGVALPPYAFNPHITLAYRPDHRGPEAIDALSWRVDNIRLIKSVTGKGVHIERGRWPLRARATA